MSVAYNAKKAIEAASPMSAIDRARQDIADGHYWLARQRVDSYLTSKGYDPELMNMLARICYEMRDANSAGRFWITGTDEGEHVDAAIETFMGAAQRDAQRIGSRLHQSARIAGMDRLPQEVQQRLRNCGIRSVSWHKRQSVHQECGIIGKAILGFAGIFVCASMVVGALVILKQLWNLLFN